MRTVVFYFFLLVAAIAPTLAHATSHPTDGNAVLLGTFGVTAAVNDVQTSTIITVWSITGGDIDYVLDVEALSFSDNCSNVNSSTLEEFVEACADAAIAEGVSRGYPACATTAYTKNVRIWSVSCAERSGSGCSTTFEACSTEAWCYRLYQVYCPGNGIPVITQGTGTTCSCSGACEGSCTESNFE